jgi:hypothetical protein
MASAYSLDHVREAVLTLDVLAEEAAISAREMFRDLEIVSARLTDGREVKAVRCKYCDEEIVWDGRFWVTGPLDSVILGRSVCQSPKSPDFRHRPKED